MRIWEIFCFLYALLLLLIIIIILDFIYLFERGRQSEQAWAVGRGRGRGRSRLLTEHGGLCGAQSQDPGSIIGNGKSLETTQLSFSVWITIHSVQSIHIWNTINKKEWTMVIHNNLYEPQEHYLQWKKPISKSQILYDFNCITSSNDKSQWWKTNEWFLGVTDGIRKKIKI